MSSDRLHVLKFGGTSVGSPARIRGVVDIVRAAQADARCVVVVSAMGGVTGTLLAAAEAAARGDEGWPAPLAEVAERHRAAATELAGPDELERLLARIEDWAVDVHDLVHGAFLVRECTPRTLDRILAHGELASSALVAAAFRSGGVPAEAVDARTLLVTDAAFGRARIDLEASGEAVRAELGADRALPVVTGFIAAARDGQTTTLGRGGSDYTAALLGSMLGADRIEIWTDVDGVLSADPTLVPDAFPLRSLTYDELMELSHFGAKVVYPPSVHPARAGGIPLVIRNTLRPETPGTWVGPGGPEPEPRAIRGISSVRDVALLRLEGDGMVGIPGIAGRLFGALARGGVSVILISQASSEHSICLAIAPADEEGARREVDAEFELERRLGLIDPLVVERDRSIVAAVGEGMRETPGLAGRVFSALGALDVNVDAIAQGSSELNISLAVHRDDLRTALRGLHEVLFEAGPGDARQTGPLPAATVGPARAPVDVYLAGVGAVGGTLLAMLAERTTLAGRPFRLTGVANSRAALVDTGGVAAGAAAEELEKRGVAGLDLVAAARDTDGARLFVDCTASAEVAARYAELLDAGVPLVAANKHAFGGPLAAYRRVRDRPPGAARAYYETTAGAGLPFVGLVESLRATGDRVLSLEGVLSGTLGFLLAEVNAGRPFSEALGEARRRGFTEPDPREDLSGADVLRKLIVLAREAGWAVEPDDVTLEPLLPEEGWADLSVDAFLARLPEADPVLEQRRQAAVERGGRLVYLTYGDGASFRVGLTEVAEGHPCHGLAGPENLLAVTTARYAQPIVVRGAGAGAEVTAAGVLADIDRALRERTGELG